MPIFPVTKLPTPLVKSYTVPMDAERQLLADSNILSGQSFFPFLSHFENIATASLIAAKVQIKAPSTGFISDFRMDILTNDITSPIDIFLNAGGVKKLMIQLVQGAAGVQTSTNTASFTKDEFIFFEVQLTSSPFGVNKILKVDALNFAYTAFEDT